MLRNQIAGDDKKQVYPDPAVRTYPFQRRLEKTKVGVDQQHCADSKCTQAIEFRLAAVPVIPQILGYSEIRF